MFKVKHIGVCDVGSRVYHNGQGSWALSVWGRWCAWVLPLRLALRARTLALPSQFALLAHGSGFALTTIKWICLLQLHEFIYFALQNLWIHLRNLWIHILNKFISKWIHLFKNKKIKNPAWELNHTNCGYTLCHTTINLLSTNVFTISILILYTSR